MNAVSRGPKNGGVCAKPLWKQKIKNGRKTPKPLQNVSADKKGRLIQALAYYCGTSSTGSNTTTGKIRRIIEVMEEIH